MSLSDINVLLNQFGNFLGGRLRNFGSISMGEKVSYISIMLGIILVLTGMVLFII